MVTIWMLVPLATAAPNIHMVFKELYCIIVVIYTWAIYRPCQQDDRHSNLVAHTARICFCINLPLIIDMKINVFANNTSLSFKGNC